MPQPNTQAAVDALPTWRAATGDRAGRFHGAGHGSEVSFFVIDMRDGQGPALHSHPYPRRPSSSSSGALAARSELGPSGRPPVTSS
jgi:hypothetical protein